MRIYKDAKSGIYFMDQRVAGKRMRKSLGTASKSVALLKLQQVADPNKATVPGCKLKDLVARYQAEVLALRRPATADRFKSALNVFQRFGAPTLAQDVTPDLLAKFQLWQLQNSKSKKAAGINRNVRAIKVLMRQAEEWGLVSSSKWGSVKKLREPKGRVEFHTEEEIEQLLSVFNPQWQLVILLGARAGLRRGEMAVLKWIDLNFSKNEIYVAPNKTDHFRIVPMAKDLKEALLVAKKDAKNEFVINVGDIQFRDSEYYITAAYAKNCKDKKLPFRCFIHKLRHTFASHLVQAGVDLYTVSKLMGHSSIKMTEIYAHLAPQTLASAIDKLPSIGK